MTARFLIPISTLIALLVCACISDLNPASPSAQMTEGTKSTPPNRISIDDGMVRVAFSASLTDFPNPERGFYSPASSGDLAKLTSTEVSGIFDKGYRLIYARIDLDRFRDKDIPETHLNLLKSGFDTARQGGVKLIVRAVYNYPSNETEYRNAKDASLDQVLAHIAQLEPLFLENADVIAYIQAGFVGAWGEWHTSSNELTNVANRTRIKDALLESTPSTRFVQFRYPPHLMEWQPVLPELRTVLSGDYRSGFHNDCFLASQTDVGTFAEEPGPQTRERRYVQHLAELGVFGGETCNPADDKSAVPRITCDDILTEGAQYHLSYLNAAYYRSLFHKNWIENGCMTEVSRSMGYRLALTSASHTMSAIQGEQFYLSFQISNSGWARPYNPRLVSIVLRESTSGELRRLVTRGADPRTWLPGTETEETVYVTLPNDLPPGTWDILFALPDANPAIRGDARYSIRLANDEHVSSDQYWDRTIGAYALGTSVTVSSMEP